MKKSLAMTLVLSLLASTSAVAAPAPTKKTATLTVQGKILEVCALTITPTASSTALNLTTQQTGIIVGSVSSQCNISSNGYKFSVDTLNGSKLSSPDGNTPVGYQINFVTTLGNTINSGGYFDANSDTLDVAAIKETAKQGANILLKTNSSTPYAGTYSDTLTFTLETL